MNYYCKLFWSERIREREKEILTKLEQGKAQLNIYLVVLTKNEKNHLEFYDSILLKQEIFRSEELFVVGIAKGYDGALEMVQKITQEVYEKTNGTDIRRFILKQQKEFEERNV